MARKTKVERWGVTQRMTPTARPHYDSRTLWFGSTSVCMLFTPDGTTETYVVLWGRPRRVPAHAIWIFPVLARARYYAVRVRRCIYRWPS